MVSLWTRTLHGIVNAKTKGSTSNALTSLAGNTYHPHDGWRCPG
jgi:hypothetical protein